MKLPALRFLRSRKFWQRSAFTFACLITLIAAAYAIENYRGRSAWENYRREAAARGAKLDVKEFIKPPIPDDENFAALPLFQDLSSPDEQVQKRAHASFRLPRIPNGKESGYFGAVGKAPPDFSAWREIFIEAKLLDSTSNDPAADVLRALNHCEPVLKDLRKAAHERPGNRLMVRWEKGVDADIYSMRGTVDLGRVLSLRSSAFAALGRTPEALAEWRTLLRLCEMYQSEPTLYTGMIRAMLLSLATGPIRVGLADRQWTAAELQELDTALAGINLHEEYALMLVGERAWSNTAFDYRLTSKTDPQIPRWWILIPEGWMYQNRVRMNRFYDRAISESRNALSLRDFDREYVVRAQSWWKQPYSYAANLVLFGLSGTQSIAIGAQSDISLTRIACALERYRMRTGTHPAQLSDLVPSELKSLPRDPFTNSPFHYRLGPNGTYALYSTGEDRRDQGGDPELDQVWNRNPNPAKEE